MHPIFVGAGDIARCDVRRARERLVETEREYRLDLQRYGRELTLDEANDRLASDDQRIQEFLTAQKLPGERGAAAKDMILEIRWDHHNPDTKRLYPKHMIHETIVTGYLEFGQAAQLLHGEKLPTIRLWTHWKNYVVGGVPDGVAKDYVYEFRATTRTGRDIETVKKQAVRQAQLYAFAFKRPRIKVQIASFPMRSKNPFPLKAKEMPNPELSTIFQPCTDEDALSALIEFDAAYSEVVY